MFNCYLFLDNNLTADQTMALTNAMSKNRSITSLDLYGTSLLYSFILTSIIIIPLNRLLKNCKGNRMGGTPGMSMLGQMLEVNQSLTSLTCGGNI